MGEPAALSFAQQGLWFLDQLAPGQPNYLVTRAFDLSGPLDLDALERALRLVAERHDVLRSRIVLRDGEPMTVAGPAAAVPLARASLAATASGLAQGMALLRQAAREPCDLVANPPLRATVIRLGEHRHLFQYTAHHIAFDGLSRVIFERELAAAYAAFTSERSPDLPALSLRYREYAAQERAAVRRDELASQEAYWTKQLSGAAGLDWPAGRAHLSQSSAASRHRFAVAADVGARLARLAAAEGTSIFVVMLAAYQYLLGQMARADDVLVGVPLANRADPRLEGLIGFFTNTVVIRADLSRAPTFLDLVRQARESVLNALDNHELPFQRVVDALGLERDSHRHPLFQNWFGFAEGELAGPGLGLPGVRCTAIEQPVTTTRFDTELEISLTGGELTGDLIYAAELFGLVTMRRFTEYYQRILSAGSADPHARLASVDFLGAQERRELMALADGSARPRAAPDLSLPQWFSLQASRLPCAVAVADAAMELTYRELDAAADALAGRLRATGVRPGGIVALYLPRCADMVVAMIAAGRADAAYLPIGREVPPGRMEYMLADSGATVLVTRRAWRPVTAGLRSCPAVLVTDDEPSQKGALARSAPGSWHSGDRLLYVIYTSGSTGQPKGVAVSHQQFAGLVRWHLDSYHPQPGDRIAQVASLSFDAAGWEVWPALLAGASLRICPDEIAHDPIALAGWASKQGIDAMFAPTPLAEQLIRQRLTPSTRLRYLLTGGDVFRPRETDDPGVPVINHYGPTENSVVATASGALAPPWTDNSIGRPIGGVTAYLVDQGLRLVPRGVIGELCLGGTGVAWGYWRRPALTAERFVPDPFSAEPGARLYRTGDLARWRPDGTLHYVGRLDEQVEVNGHRIEPAEVEAELLSHPAIRAVAVAAKMSPSAGQVLAGYVVPHGTMPPTDELRRHLARRLPRYMIPQAFVALTELPATASGKLDRVRLPELASPTAGRSAPLGPCEHAMARLWKEILGIQAVDVRDDFFALGGNSMSAARLLNQIRAAFGTDISMRDIFDNPTLAELSSVVGSQVRAEVAAMSPAEIATAITNAP